METTRPAVLLVDDERDIREALELLFTVSVPDIQLVTAASGPEALSYLKKNKVAAIVTDFRMPIMDGIEFLKAASKVAPTIPAVMITAYPDPALIERVHAEAKVEAVLSKPFDMDAFIRLVRALVQ